MKKIFLSLALLAILAIAGCQKEQMQNNKLDINIQNQINSFQIAETHNEILSNYFKTKGDNDVYDFVENFMITEKKYDKQEVSQIIEKIKTENNFIAFKNDKKESEILLYLDTLKNKFNLSDDLMNEIIKVWNESASNPDSVKNIVINEIQNRNWEGNDKLVSDVFVDVFLHSYDFWNNKYKNIKLKPGSDVIIGDAIGAIHGLIFWGVGSIIEGAVVSLIINEHWYDKK